MQGFILDLIPEVCCLLHLPATNMFSDSNYFHAVYTGPKWHRACILSALHFKELQNIYTGRTDEKNISFTLSEHSIIKYTIFGTFVNFSAKSIATVVYHFLYQANLKILEDYRYGSVVTVV